MESRGASGGPSGFHGVPGLLGSAPGGHMVHFTGSLKTSGVFQEVSLGIFWILRGVPGALSVI